MFFTGGIDAGGETGEIWGVGGKRSGFGEFEFVRKPEDADLA